MWVDLGDILYCLRLLIVLVWVHPDNLLEVKTVILRRLPVLVYNPQTSKVAEAGQKDPSITSIYFDNPNFSLYDAKVAHTGAADSLRLRWHDHLSSKPEIMFEKKTVKVDDESEERRFPIKDKYIEPFIKGEYKMEKQIHKLAERAGPDSTEHNAFKQSVDQVQSFIKEHELQPVLRANYTRTAFQIPGDSRIRISLDTNLAFIREDAIDTERPIRDPDEWHRKDIDDQQLEYPFKTIRKGEVSRFPFAILEIKIKNERNFEWINDLTHSHLVKEAPRFSKFVHGVASLFDDHVNVFPFWLSALEEDIRQAPEDAFKEEQAKKQRQAEDDVAVGSFINKTKTPQDKLAMSPVGSPSAQKPASLSTKHASQRLTASLPPRGIDDVVEEADSDDDGAQAHGAESNPRQANGLTSLFPSFSTSKYASRKRGTRDAPLPPGVAKPEYWIKDQGPNKVEAKVWLANQRTFIKWQHVSVLLAGLSLGLYNAAGVNNDVARALSLVYTLLAVFIGAWGYGVYVWRSNLIQRRSGKDFDALTGPIVTCVGLIVALCLNFGFKVCFV